MSCTEIETVASSTTDIDGGDVRLRKKTARIDDTLQTRSTNIIQPRRVCRRHSFAFRCGEYELDQDGDEGKHFENVLLVKVLHILALESWLMSSSICCWRE